MAEHRRAAFANNGLVGDAAPGRCAQRTSRTHIDLASGDHDPIDVTRRVDRDVFVENIFEYSLRIPIHGMAVAATTCSDTHRLITRANFNSEGADSLFSGGAWK